MLPGQLSDSDRQKIRHLPWYYAHGALTNIFFLWTFGGTVFLLFLSELGLPKQHIGILLSFFPFSGLVALFFAPTAARVGWKKVFLAAFTSRYITISTLLFLPWVMARWGQTAGVMMVTVVMLAVALERALGETAFYPWMQVFIPNVVRGRASALAGLSTTIACGLALFVAGRVLAAGEGLDRFLWLLGVGTVIGLLGILCMVPVPAGEKQPPPQNQSHLGSMLAALRDPALAAYLAGMGLVTLGSVFLTSFLPLYIKEELGLAAETIVTLDIVVMAGGAVSGLASGWAADRVGSRPVLVLSLCGLLVLPLVWFFLPGTVPQLLLWIGGLYLANGVFANAAYLAAMRLLFNRIVPAGNATPYTALYYAWMGLTGGMAPFLAGQILGIFSVPLTAVAGQPLTGYRILFLTAFLLLAGGLLAYRLTPQDGRFTTRGALGWLAGRLRG